MHNEDNGVVGKQFHIDRMLGNYDGKGGSDKWMEMIMGLGHDLSNRNQTVPTVEQPYSHTHPLNTYIYFLNSGSFDSALKRPHNSFRKHISFSSLQSKIGETDWIFFEKCIFKKEVCIK